jgi:hypothetical protein
LPPQINEAMKYIPATGGNEAGTALQARIVIVANQCVT